MPEIQFSTVSSVLRITDIFATAQSSNVLCDLTSKISSPFAVMELISIHNVPIINSVKQIEFCKLITAQTTSGFHHALPDQQFYLFTCLVECLTSQHTHTQMKDSVGS